LSWLLLPLGLALMLFGAPFFALIAALVLLGFHNADYSLSGVINEFARIGSMHELLPIPLFTIAGYLLSESRAPARLVRVTEALVGGRRGGLAIVALITCALFTALTGASGVTIVALGAVLLPALRTARYDERFSLGLLTTSGSLGLLFAPSIPLIVYALVAQQLVPVRVDELFMAGLLPGLLMIVVLGGYSLWKAPPRAESLPKGELWAAVKDAGWELPLPIVVFGGIYLGWLAPSDAAPVTALYVLLVTVVVRREIKLKQLPRVLRDAAVLVGAILTILGMSLALTNYLIDRDIPAQLFAFIEAHLSNKYLFLLALNLFLMVFGMLLEGFPAIVILTPLVLPIAQGFGIDPVHFGIMFLANLQIGLFLPPLGMNLYIAAARFRQPVATLIRASLPFFLLLLACVLIITYVPWLSLALLDR
jgi:C4-dicarboxylate transporter, DctM subunit